MSGPLLIVQIAAVVVYFLGIVWTGSFFYSYPLPKKIAKVAIALILGTGVFFLIGAGLWGIVFVFVTLLLFFQSFELSCGADLIQANSVTDSGDDILSDGFE